MIKRKLNIIPQNFNKYKKLTIQLTFHCKKLYLNKISKNQSEEVFTIMQWLVKNINCGKGIVGFAGKVLFVNEQNTIDEILEILNQGLQISTAMKFTIK